MNLLYKVANWKIILPLFFIFLSFGLYFFPKYQAVMNKQSGKELHILDLRMHYSPQEVQILFDEMGKKGRDAYKVVCSRVDAAYPIVYGALLILLIAAKTKTLRNPKWVYLIIFPIIVVIVDFVENYNTLRLLNAYPNLDDQLIKTNSLITGIKWFFVALSLSALVWVNILTLKSRIKDK